MGRFSHRNSPGRFLAAVLAAVRPLPRTETRVSGTVLVDESGDLGRGPGSSRAFTMTATVTGDPDELAAIAGRYPRNTRTNGRGPDELKFKTSSDSVRLDVLRDVMATGPSIHAVVVGKPEMFHSTKRQVYERSAEALMDDVMRDPVLLTARGPIRVVYDDHQYLRGGTGERIAGKAAETYGVRLSSVETADSAGYAPLQAHDFVAGAVGSKYNSGRREDFDLIGSRAKVRNIRIKR